MPGDADPSKWDCPPHTKAKHEMLRRYLDGWYPIMSKWSGRLLFLDGFAGRGRYNDGSVGSPLIALHRLVDHRWFDNMSDVEFVFLFVEADAANAASLEAELAAFQAQRPRSWPKNVKYHVVHEAFDKTAGEIIADLREQKKRLAPTFAFVDPFGYSGLPMELLAELLAPPAKTELFVNFMAGHVQRFITRDGQERAMRTLFGKDVSDVLADWELSGDRVQHLIDVYAQQLRDAVGFPHVQTFKMKNETGNIGYCLLHGTRHRQGVKLMKAAMWAVDPGGGYTFSDRTAGQDVLFQANPDLRPLRRAIVKHYHGRTNVLVRDIEWFAILDTAYRETQIRKVLGELEGEGKISVDRPGKHGFPADKTRITFL